MWGLDIQVPFLSAFGSRRGVYMGWWWCISEAAGRLWKAAGRALSINDFAEGFYTHEFAIYWVFAVLQPCFIESDSLICLFLRCFWKVSGYFGVRVRAGYPEARYPGAGYLVTKPSTSCLMPRYQMMTFQEHIFIHFL